MRCSKCRETLVPPAALVCLAAIFVAAAIVVGCLYVGLGLGAAAAGAFAALAWPAGYSITQLWNAYDDGKRDARAKRSPHSEPATADGM